MFRFIVELWEENELVQQKGYISAESYGQAMERLIDWLSPQEIVSIKIYECYQVMSDEELLEEGEEE